MILRGRAPEEAGVEAAVEAARAPFLPGWAVTRGTWEAEAAAPQRRGRFGQENAGTYPLLALF